MWIENTTTRAKGNDQTCGQQYGRTLRILPGQLFPLRRNVQEEEEGFNSHLRPPEEVFYVLEGLTTDVLIGAELVFGRSFFTEQKPAFIDLDVQGMLRDINTIKWLSTREKKLVNASNRQALTRNPHTATELEVFFQQELNDDDGREQYLQETIESELAQFDGPERKMRLDEEKKRRRLHHENRTKRIQEHDRKLATMAQQARNGDSSGSN